MKNIKYLKALLIILSLFFIISCDKNKEFDPTVDKIMYPGENFEFKLTNEVKDINEPKVFCVMKDALGNIFEREAMFNRVEDIGHIIFMHGVADGKFLLLSIDFIQNDDKWQGRKSIGVGRYLEAKGGKIEVVGAYSSEYGWGGNGTKEQPYLISTEADLYNLMGFVNSEGREIPFVGKYFLQCKPLDMGFYSNYVNDEYGWLPIGESAATPFAGCYDGGGYKVSNLRINRNLQSGVGLFGVLYNGIVQNVVLNKASIVGDGAVGGVVGAVIGDGENLGVSLIRHCSVDSSTVMGNVGVGGIVGMVDKLVRVEIDTCTTYNSSTILCTQQAVGGIMGGAVTNSAIAFDGCINWANISSSSVNAGGIAGGVDTVMVLSCNNYGNITASNTVSSVMGIGGILGGAGVCNVFSSHNYGKVQGYKGVGGIIGSSLVANTGDDGSGAVYNNVFIQSSHNEGTITGNQMVGGLCGEAQIAIMQSYNKGDVTAKGDYVGGLFGSTSVAAIHCSNNFGNVEGCNNVGGIGGKVQEGTFALNTNFGNVMAKENWAGGIFGKTGNQSVINYCGNYGTISLDDGNGKGNIGGIAGEIGDPREWSGWDIAEVVIGSAEVLVGAVGGTAFCIAALKGAEGAQHAIHIAHTVADAVLTCANSVTLGYGANLLNFGITDDYLGMAKIRADKLTQECIESASEMEQLVNSAISSTTFSASALKLSTEPLKALKDNRTSQIDFYTRDSINHNLVNRRLNEVRNERYHEVEEDKHTEEMIHSIVQGVCMGLTIAGMLVGSVATGGFSVAAVIGTAAVGIVGGVNSITKGAMNYETNTLVISQSFNYGDIKTSQKDCAGGIVGRMADYSKISDCLNAGTITNGYAIAGGGGGKLTIERCLNLYGNEPLPMHGDINTGGEINHNKLYCNSLSEDEWKSESKHHSKYCLDEAEDLLIVSTVCKKESYSNWDLEKMWSLNGSGTSGMYPVPKVSEMTYESQGHH